MKRELKVLLASSKAFRSSIDRKAHPDEKGTESSLKRRKERRLS